MDMKDAVNNAVKKLLLDSDMCIWCWACVAITADYWIFEFGEDGKAFINKQPSNDKEVQAAQEAIEWCCVNAITWAK